MLSYPVQRSIKERICRNLIHTLQSVSGVENWLITRWLSEYQQYPDRTISEIIKTIKEITSKKL